MPFFWKHSHYLVLLLADKLLCNIDCSSDGMDLELFLHMLGRGQLRGLKNCKLWHEQDTTAGAHKIQPCASTSKTLLCAVDIHRL